LKTEVSYLADILSADHAFNSFSVNLQGRKWEKIARYMCRILRLGMILNVVEKDAKCDVLYIRHLSPLDEHELKKQRAKLRRKKNNNDKAIQKIAEGEKVHKAQLEKLKHKDAVEAKLQEVEQQLQIFEEYHHSEIVLEGLPLSVFLQQDYLAKASPERKKNMLGGYLFPLVQQRQPEKASKITGMLLAAMDVTELISLLESDQALEQIINQALEELNRVDSEESEEEEDDQG